MKSIAKPWLSAVAVLLFVSSCSSDSTSEDPIPEVPQEQPLVVSHTLSQLKSAYGNGGPIPNGVVIGGIVISTDIGGNMKELVLQDSTAGILIALAVDDLHTKFPLDSGILVKCEGLIYEETLGVLGNPGSSEINADQADSIFFKDDIDIRINPNTIRFSDGLESVSLGTLVRMVGVQFAEEEVGEVFGENELRHVYNEDNISIPVFFSSDSEFGAEVIPEQAGTITGIMTRQSGDLVVKPRFSDDLNMTWTRNPPFEKRVYYYDSDSLPYQIMFPRNYDTTQEYPLVVFLHGAGERGNNNTSQMAYGPDTFGSIAARTDYPAIVIFPQCPSDVMWSRRTKEQIDGVWIFDFPVEEEPNYAMNMAIELVRDLSVTEAVDQDRIYVAGLSMGGIGTFEFLYYASDIPAAVVSLAGGHDPVYADSYAEHVSFWIFHGANDGVVPPKYSRDMYSELLRLQADVTYTEDPERGHEWNYALERVELLPWLFEKERVR